MKLLIIHQRSELYEKMSAFCRASDKPWFRDLEIDYYRDTNAAMAENYEAYVQRTEQNGPEWIEPDPIFLEKIADADIVMTEWGGISKRVIDAAKQLKLIVTIRSAPENIEVEYANARGIQVSISPSRLANAVADMTVGMMISETRGLLRRNLVYNKGEWVREKYDDASHSTLSNLKIGLVGYGGIARVVSRRLVQGFGCEVAAYETITPEAILREDGVTPVDLETLCRTCDIISMHARHVEGQNDNMITREHFRMMKPNAIFINTARAGLVDEEALIEALQKGWIRGAGLDVYSVEPISKDSPLLKMDNVTLMPHSAGATGDIIQNSLKIINTELERFMLGQELKFSVSRRK